MNKWLMCIILLVSFNVQAAQPNFNVGEIISVSAKIITFDDQRFLLSPTVKVWTVNETKTSLSKLKTGDYVALKMIKIGNKTLVDDIYISPFRQ